MMGMKRIKFPYPFHLGNELNHKDVTPLPLLEPHQT
jgi:hypothetical protein